MRLTIRMKTVLLLVALAAAPLLAATALAARLFLAGIDDEARARVNAGIPAIEAELSRTGREIGEQLATFSRMLPVRRAVMLARPAELRHQLVPLAAGFGYGRLHAYDTGPVALMRAEDPGRSGDSVAGDPAAEAVAAGRAVTGFALRGDGVWLEAARPIVVDGEPCGGLVAGRRIDRAFLDRLAALAGFDLALRAGGDPIATSAAARDLDAVGTAPVRLAHGSGDHYLAALPLAGHGGRPAGRIVALLPVGALRAKALRSANALLLVAAGALALAAALGLFFGGRLAGPLVRFRDAATRMAGGHLDERVPDEGRDEIAELARALNRMAGNLRILFETARQAAFAGNVDALAERIVEAAVAACGAERGSLMIFDERRGKLAIARVAGYAGKVIERVALDPGEGIAGLAFSGGATVVSDDAANDPRFAPAPGAEGAVRNIAAVPLVADDAPVGVISVVNKPGAFDAADRSVLESMASHLSQAIRRARLYELAITDGLTGLYIHRYFQARLADEIGRSARTGAPVSLLMTDVDHFKNVNDTHGHQQGDVVLRELADLIRGSIRSIDIPARYGGEEFAVVLSNAPRQAAAELAERLRRKVEAHGFPTAAGPAMKATISVGVATFPDDAASAADLVRRADERLYRAKRGGRNRVVAAE